MMITPLALLLFIKITVTFFTVGLPFLVLRPDLIEKLSGFSRSPPPLYRLYGVAILALLVGYSGGLAMVMEGEYPFGVVAMGIFSNLGAALTLLLTGQFRANRLNLALTVFFAAIAAGLIAMALNPSWALSPLG